MKTVLVRAAMAALLIATGPAEAGHYMAGPAEVGHHVGRAAEVRHHAAGPAEIGHRVLTADVLAASRRPEIVEGQDAHLTFTVGSATAGRGHKAYGVLKVPAGKDAAKAARVMASMLKMVKLDIKLLEKAAAAAPPRRKRA